MQTNPRLNIRQVTWANPVGADLRAAQQAELDARFGTQDHEPGPPPSEADTAVFLVAYEKGSGQPVGCGGLEDAGLHNGGDQAAVRPALHARLGRCQLHPRRPGGARLRHGRHLDHRRGGLGPARRPELLPNCGFEPKCPTLAPTSAWSTPTATRRRSIRTAPPTPPWPDDGGRQLAAVVTLRPARPAVG